MATAQIVPSPGLNFSSLLADIPRGAWVALSSDALRVIAYSADMHEVLRKAEQLGEKDPILTRVPESQTALAF